MAGLADRNPAGELRARKLRLKAQQNIAARELGLPAPKQFPHHALHEITLGRAWCEFLADDDAQPGLCLAVGAHVQHEVRSATPGPQSKNG